MIIKQPNGLYAVWSGVSDEIVHYDATPEDIIAAAVERSKAEITESVMRIIAQLDAGENPYHQFTMTFDEAMRTMLECHDEDDEWVLQVCRDLNYKIPDDLHRIGDEDDE